MRWYEQRDKQLHLVVGLVIGLAVSFAVGLYFAGVHQVVAGTVAAFTAGVCKEVYDQYNDGTVETVDAIVTGVGGIVGALIGYFI
jgi:hypothetical protein